MRLHVVNWLDRENPLAGGAEIHLHEIFGRVASEGHEVTLLCSGWPGCAPRAELDGIHVHRAGTRYTFQFHARRYWRRHLRAAQPDVLLEDINKVPLYTPLWGARRTVVLVPHLFGATAFREANPAMAAAVWLSERPISLIYRGRPFQAISQSTAEDLVTRGVPASAIRVIYPGVDTSAYTPDAAQRASTPHFAYIGRLKRYKGVELAIRAFAGMQNRSAVLEIAGSGDDRPRLERLARSLDLGERVRFLGFIDENAKLALLRRSWALLFASPKEGWGITNLESAASGTAVIASDSPGLRESVRDGETGFLVTHGDMNSMARALDRLAADRALAERLGARGRIFAEQFTWEAAASQTEAHLREIIEAA